MSTGLTVVVAAGWVFNILLSVILVLLIRQVGLLSRRLPAYGARDDHEGPALGTLAPSFSTRSLAGEPASTVPGRQNLLVFVSTTCEACAELMPSVKSIIKSTPKLNTLVVSNADVDQTTVFARANGLAADRVVSSPDVGKLYGVMYPPYAFAIDESGIVRAKGLVNHAEHVASLLATLAEPRDAGERQGSANGRAPSLINLNTSSPTMGTDGHDHLERLNGDG